MCLSKLIETEDLSRTEFKNYKDLVGWKVFNGIKQFNSQPFFKDKFIFQYQFVALDYISRRKWLKSSKIRMDFLKRLHYESLSTTYKNGFHIFLSHKDAVLWRNIKGIKEYDVIKKVKFRGATSLGCQKMGSCLFPFDHFLNCVIADEILVL